MTFHRRSTCRLCEAALPQAPSLELEPTPLANEFLSEAQRAELARERDGKQELFPLVLYTCTRCGHVQLPVVVSPTRLFQNYVYVAGTSPVFVDHFRRYARAMLEKLFLSPGEAVVDIGSNDGTLLRFFKEAGMSVVGVDPAREIAREATESGVPTIEGFFSPSFVEPIRARLPAGKPVSLVTANNVFAHADDLHSIVEGVKTLIGDEGAFVFEVSYLVDVCEKTLFDTIYHEHVSYHTVEPLIRFFRQHGMTLFDAERVDTHGGSLRGYARVGSPDEASDGHKRVMDLVALERRLGFGPGADRPLQELQAKIRGLGTKLTGRLQGLKREGKLVVAFGAPAKATTLMYQFKLDGNVIDFVIDDSPLKQGLLTPGTHIPVVPSEALYSRKPDYAVILAWNFADPIIKKHRAYLEQKGTFIVPIPEYREVSQL
jgi:SAM-dependent methyltransferase